ncbi:hypothetical protein BU24DRAFT_458779 [Aaosphaeria arxii CBS 175.79]|uniref:FAM192A/Fyv6 N-terminal domain-containing protein n=1 Tax=Aaosphaeria arxii CBS 175.79 TaxID=1450172 RepID=A0A6A5Y0K4_9PLEO|nr:uncharacterized protein BU24DRAFT_458779 [Aaosphaeria arxii CBS 175.79]KAF2019068.1 hypothetical protein BU24DRAFT_458779 [Aaosphaeria arxii CBS 175.79]
MSSGFVSGGTVDNPVERDDEWHAAQKELAEKRRQKELQENAHDGKSLYEVLQANKAAKQDAFEEANRLKNQFRALDDSEAEFLDAVLESTRKQEETIRKDTLEQLDLFRKHQEEVERKALLEQNAGDPVTAEGAPQWGVNRKRKKGNEKDGGLLRGAKSRKASSGAAEMEPKKAVADELDSDKKANRTKEKTVAGRGSDSVAGKEAVKSPQALKPAGAASPPAKPTVPLSLGLGYASSDDDD